MSQLNRVGGRFLLWGLCVAAAFWGCGSPTATARHGGGAAGLGGGSGTSGAGNSTGGELVLGDSGIPADGGVIVASKLVFDPASVTLNLDGTTPKSATYTLIATFPDGTTHDVSAQALQFDRPDLASVVSGPPVVLTASGAMAGTGTLHAVYGGLEATATLIVNVAETHVVGTVAGSAITALGKSGLPADPKLSSLLYPYDKTVFPLGVNTPTLMWTAPSSGDVYRISFSESGYTYDLYEAVSVPTQVSVPQDAWDRVTASNSGDKLVLSVSRWDSQANSAYASATESFTIAPESLSGAIYYWTASQTTTTGRVGSITRIYPGSGAKPEKLNQGRCMGCHSVSADGSTLVATIEDPSAPSVAPYSNWTNERAWASFTLPAATLALQTTKSGANSALSPTGTWVVFGGRSDNNPATGLPYAGSKFISLAPTATGAVIATSGLDNVQVEGNDGLMMPSFSPDGTKLALVEAGGDLHDNVLPSPSVRILYLSFDTSKAKTDPTLATFDPTVHEVVRANAFKAGDDQLGYPAFTPDSQYVAYHTGQYSTGCHGDCLDDQPDNGELWLSPIAGGTPIRLANLDDPPAAADHFVHREPTFCPVARGGYYWVVFTSMRDWGNALTGAAINGKRRLWVAAIDAKIGSVDPSHPAFFIEAQAHDTPNMRGFWALAQCIATPKAGTTGQACTAGFQCCSGFCVGGQCIDKSKLTCAGVGGACVAAGDCCNQSVTDCVSQICKVVQGIR